MTQDSLSLPGLGDANGGAQVTAYGNPSWSGLALISGTWYAQSASTPEIDVNTLFLNDTNTAVGDTYTLVNGIHKVTAKIVGEVFRPGNDLNIFMSPATLTAIDPTVAGPGYYAVSLKPGVNADAYAGALQTTLGNTYNVNAFSGGAKALLAVVTLIAMLTLLIIVVAGLGVLNTVALQIRERAHDIGIFKAVGMTPRQTLTMVICSVGITGLVAGIIAVPAGILLHHQVLPAMGHAANSRSAGLAVLRLLGTGSDDSRPGGPGHRHRRSHGPGELGGEFPHRHRTPHGVSHDPSAVLGAGLARRRGRQGRSDARLQEGESGRLQPGRQRPAAAQQLRRDLAESQPQRTCRYPQYGGPVQGSSQRLGQLGVGDRLRRGQVERPAQVRLG